MRGLWQYVATATLLGTAAVFSSCSGAPPSRAPHPSTATPGHAPTSIVVTERSPRGGRLVFVAEDGRRMAELTNIDVTRARDVGAAWSPDGAWIAFESSRGRSSLSATSLWMVASGGGQLSRLTIGKGVERDAAWGPKSRVLVYSSIAEDGKSFDLWRAQLVFDNGLVRLGKRIQLTDTAENELHPAISPDGSTLVFQRANDAEGSSIWIMPLAGGAATQLTSGPADLTPTYSPDGQTVAFARGRVVRLQDKTTRIDTDLFFVRAAGSKPVLVVANPLADENGPHFTRDGRFLFATSVYRAAKSDEPLLGSITYVDLSAKKKLVLRALHEPGAVETRTGPALGPAPLDAKMLKVNEPYVEALYQVLQEQYIRRGEGKSGKDS